MRRSRQRFWRFPLNRHVPPLLAALSAELFSLAVAINYLASNDMFGAGDMPAMVFWSLPLSLFVYFAFRALLRRAHFSSALARYLVFTLTGALLGIANTALTLLLLGGWIFAFSFPVLYCWVIGGALAGVVASWLTAPPRWSVAFVLVLLAWFGLSRLTSYASMPEPQVRVTLEPGLAAQDEERFWTEVIGTRGKRPHEHDLLYGISGAAIGGHQNGSAIFVVSLRRELPARRVDSVIARIRRSPLVQDVRLIGGQ